MVFYPCHILERIFLLYLSDFVSCQDKLLLLFASYEDIREIIDVTAYICYLFHVFCACKYFCHSYRNPENIPVCVLLPRCGNMQKRTFVTPEQLAVFRCFAYFRSMCC
jgi:hypothetical protein